MTRRAMASTFVEYIQSFVITDNQVIQYDADSDRPLGGRKEVIGG